MRTTGCTIVFRCITASEAWSPSAQRWCTAAQLFYDENSRRALSGTISSTASAPYFSTSVSYADSFLIRHRITANASIGYGLRAAMGCDRISGSRFNRDSPSRGSSSFMQRPRRIFHCTTVRGDRGRLAEFRRFSRTGSRSRSWRSTTTPVNRRATTGVSAALAASTRSVRR